QPVYDQVFDANDSFPMWFAVVSMVAASASLLNALLVVRLGMRRLASIAFAGQALCSAAVTLLWLVAPGNSAMFAVFIFWQASVFFITGLTIGNLNAIAMEPMGHIAGMAASVIGSVATVAGAVFAMPVGLVFDGTLLPLSAGLTAVNLGAWATLVFMRRVEQRLGLR
ncbi:MAG: multidrug MFS transporter, partial [Lutimaribacter sp.]